MADITYTKVVSSLVSSKSLAAAGTERATYDLRTAHGALITAMVTNGATGPTTACNCTIYVAHNTGPTPSSGAEGSDWKYYMSQTADKINSSKSRFVFMIPKEALHIQIEFTGHTGQAVTIEAQISVVTKAVSS